MSAAPIAYSPRPPLTLDVINPPPAGGGSGGAGGCENYLFDGTGGWSLDTAGGGGGGGGGGGSFVFQTTGALTINGPINVSGGNGGNGGNGTEAETFYWGAVNWAVGGSGGGGGAGGAGGFIVLQASSVTVNAGLTATGGTGGTGGFGVSGVAVSGCSYCGGSPPDAYWGGGGGGGQIVVISPTKATGLKLTNSSDAVGSTGAAAKVTWQNTNACLPNFLVNNQQSVTILAGASGSFALWGNCLSNYDQNGQSVPPNVFVDGVQVPPGELSMLSDANITLNFTASTFPQGAHSLTVTTLNGTSAAETVTAVTVTLQGFSFTNSVAYSRDCTSNPAPQQITQPTWPAAVQGVTCGQIGYAGDHAVYVAGNTMNGTATFAVEPVPLQSVTGVYIQGTTAGSGTFTVSPSPLITIDGPGFSVNVVVDTPFAPGQTQFLAPLTINWSAGQSGASCAVASTCASAGASANPVYVTLANNVLPSGWPVMLTYAALAVGQGGATSPAAAVAQTWAQFSTGGSPANVTTWSGTPLAYYPPNVPFSGCALDAVGLLTEYSQNGQCGSFAYLLQAALAMNGIPIFGPVSSPSPPPGSPTPPAPTSFAGVCPSDNTAMLIANWTPGTPSHPTPGPYIYEFAMATPDVFDMVPSPPPTPSGLINVYGDFTNASGLPGQNGSPTSLPPYTPSEKFFGSHYIVQLPDWLAGAVPGGPFLDPSYGLAYANGAAFERGVAGYGVMDPNTKYFGNDASHWVIRTPTPPSNISLLTLPPVQATLAAPANGATGVALTPTFQWPTTVAGDTTKYTLWISTSPSFATAGTVFFTISFPLSSFGLSPSTPLAAGTTYYWKVVAANCLYSAAPSAVWSFTTAP